MIKSNKKTNSKYLSLVIKYLYPLYIPVIQALRTNPQFIKLLFKVNLCKGDKVSWDFTTLVLKYALKQRLSNNNSSSKHILEIGVGQAALLCIFLAKTYGLIADGVDIITERVNRSKRTATYNSVNLNIWQSDLFQQVEKSYDFIFWNAAYIPTKFGEHHQLTQLDDIGDQHAWNGGDDGTHSIRQFLDQAPHHLNTNGEILLGVNHFYVSPSVMETIIQTKPLELINCISKRFNPSAVYVLKKK